MYDYKTPEGYGDYFYVYVYNPGQKGLINGQSYAYIPIEIQDGGFVLRAWGGASSTLSGAGAVSTWGKIQIYDASTRLFFDVPVSVFSNSNTNTAVLPEKEFPLNSALRFDLSNVQLALDLTAVTPVSQLAFYGVRREMSAVSDPAPSDYAYKEEDFSYSITFTLNTDATATGPGSPVQFTIPIQDNDFELRRIEYTFTNAGGVTNSQDPNHPEFQMVLYDNNWRARSNGPVNCNRLCHYVNAANNPLNFFPSPGITYKVNSVIRFDVLSLIP
jgi:hypothetical protein